MNFEIIPFFLAANVAVNQTDPWIHGPEYIFHANLTYVLSTDLMEEPFFATNLTTLLKCRPVTTPPRVDLLLCRFEDIATETLNEEPLDETEIERPFLVKFDQRGVDSLMFPEVIDAGRLNMVRTIVKELSIGVDLKENANALPAFVAKENYVLGECATLFTVLRYNKNEGLFGERHRTLNYGLRVLSLAEDESNSVVVIEKRTEHKRCMKTENPFYKRQELDVKVKKSVSKMYISDDMFRSQTEMQIKMRKTASRKDFIVQDTTIVELLGIEPAKEELPAMSFNVVANLSFGTGIDHNFL